MQAKIVLLIALLSLTISGLSAVNEMPVIAQFTGEHHNSKFGYTIVSLDFNHDGYDDLAVCAFSYGYNYGATPSRGKVYVYYGGPNFSSSTPASLTVEGDYANSVGRWIKQIFKVGDINGDGFDDLCVHVEDNITWDESNEKLLFFYGGTSNLDNPDYILDMSENVYTFHSLYPLGDVNGDSYDEMGIYYVDYPSYSVRFSILWGGAYQEQVVTEGEVSESLACAIHGIGDIDNDGYEDFTTAFATPEIHPTHNIVRLYHGNAEGDTDNYITMIECQYGVSRGSKPLGDMNADGYDDFMGYITEAGMHIWLGSADIDYLTPSFNMDPAWYGGEFQNSLEHGDFNNDGFEDTAGASYNERAFSVWLGKAQVNGTSDLIKHNAGYENYGYRLVTGDFNADGYDDVAVAAAYEYNPWPTGNFNGFVWVYAGNAQLADTTVANDDPGVPQVPAGMELRLSPNPVFRSQGFVTAQISGSKLPESAQGTAEVFNIRGQKVFSTAFQVRAQSANIALSVSDLPAGVYTCRVTVAGSSATHRFTRLP